MRVLVVGLGSIGRRHLANLVLIEPSATPIVWRLRALDKEDPTPYQVVRTLSDALALKPDAALVTCPASLHVEIATALAQHGIPLFVEKPLSHSLTGVEHLLDLCRGKGVLLMVGYNLRFYPPLQTLRRAVMEGGIGRLLSLRAEVGQYLPDWRPGIDYRGSVSARAELGGGAVLELSHEIDYVRWIAGDVRQVTACVAKLSDLDLDVEDTAEIVCTFESGAIGSLHLDMVQRPPTRNCRVVGTEGVLVWDHMTHEVQLVRGDGTRESIHPPADVPVNLSYLDELRHFLHAVRTGSAPLVSGDDGLRTLVIAEAAKQSSRERRAVDIP